MATKIYESSTVYTIYGKEIYLTPLKIKYLRSFMEEFENIKNESDSFITLAKCTAIAMKQYMPEIKTVEDVEDNFDMSSLYEIIKIASGVDLLSKEDSKPNNQKTDNAGWSGFDIAKLEAEVFLIGKWKDYEELELSMSLPELTATLQAKKEKDYEDKRFMAALQGVDLDEQSGKQQEEDPWEAMKARVAARTSGIDVVSTNDITSFQGLKAQQAGFGIGMGLSYEKIQN